MPKIKLFTDFQGVETREVFYQAGIHNVPDDVASRLVKDGRAEFVKPDVVHDVEPQFENVTPEAPKELKSHKRGGK